MLYPAKSRNLGRQLEVSALSINLKTSVNISLPCSSLHVPRTPLVNMDPPRTKRQKVNVACDPCRSRKIKCDGCQPVCGTCHKKPATVANCTWKSGFDRMSGNFSTESGQWANFEPQFQSTMPHERHLSGVAYQGHNSPTSAGGSRPTDSDLMRSTFFPADLSPSAASPLVFELRGGRHIDSGIIETHKTQTAERTDEVSPSEHSVHAIIGNMDEDSSAGFFGSSSAGTFMQNVRKMVQQKVGHVSEQPNSSQHHIHTKNLSTSGRGAIQSRPVEYVLPSRRRADILMACYWKYVHTLYPYLDKIQIDQDYEKLWRAADTIADEKSYMCLMNVMFALSSQIDNSTPTEDRQKLAHVFYIRARELLDIVEAGSVRSVQSMLLLGQYFQSTSEPHPCWIFTGLAVRTAQSLGLHLAETSERVTDIRTRELLRKMWHGCILMDRVVSMTYGRPCMIGPKAALAVPLPLPIDEEYLVPGAIDGQHGQTSRAEQTHAAEFYVFSLKLFEIMHDILFDFYSVNYKPCLEGDKYFGSLDQGQHSVFEMERRISTWNSSIPAHLRITTGHRPQVGTPEAMLYRQAVVLRQR